jgi:hypothetical protein
MFLILSDMKNFTFLSDEANKWQLLCFLNHQNYLKENMAPCIYPRTVLCTVWQWTNHWIGYKNKYKLQYKRIVSISFIDFLKP